MVGDMDATSTEREREREREREKGANDGRYFFFLLAPDFGLLGVRESASIGQLSHLFLCILKAGPFTTKRRLQEGQECGFFMTLA